MIRYSPYLTDVREAWGPFWPEGSPEAVWLALGDSKRVGRIDKTTGVLTVSEELAGVCYAISEVRNAWLYAVAGRRLYQLDPATLAVERSVELFKEERGDGWVDQRDGVLVAPGMDGIGVYNAETLELAYEVQIKFHVGKIDYDEPNSRWILYSRVGSEAAYFTHRVDNPITGQCYWLFSITYNYDLDDWNTPEFEDYGCGESSEWYEDTEWPETALLIRVWSGTPCRVDTNCSDDPGNYLPDLPGGDQWILDWIEEHRPPGPTPSVCDCGTAQSLLADGSHFAVFDSYGEDEESCGWTWYEEEPDEFGVQVNTAYLTYFKGGDFFTFQASSAYFPEDGEPSECTWVYVGGDFFAECDEGDLVFSESVPLHPDFLETGCPEAPVVFSCGGLIP